MLSLRAARSGSAALQLLRRLEVHLASLVGDGCHSQAFVGWDSTKSEGYLGGVEFDDAGNV